MAARPATELLYDSEASYRMVDGALGDFGASRASLAVAEPAASDVRSLIQEELFGLMAHLHFQDISAQQLTYASRVISEMQVLLAEHDLPRTPVAMADMAIRKD